jgi:spore germination protein GerM
MNRWTRWIVFGLLLAVFLAAVYVPSLRRRTRELRKAERNQAQALRAIEQPKIASPTDVKVKAKLFWASADNQGALAPVEIELGLSADPVLRAKQVLDTLIAGPVDADLRTLPSDAVLLEFYLLKDGTAIADFSEALATEVPSGIQSEQLAVDSIARTLEANVPQVRRIKILIHGQEVDTLAGHLDLTGFFFVRAPALPTAPAAAVPASPAQPQSPVGKKL